MLGLTFAVAMTLAGLAHRLVGAVAAFAIGAYLSVPAWCSASFTAGEPGPAFFACRTYLGMSFPGFPRHEVFTPLSYLPAIVAGLTAAVLVYLIARRLGGSDTGRHSSAGPRTAVR